MYIEKELKRITASISSNILEAYIEEMRKEGAVIVKTSIRRANTNWILF